MVSTPLTSGKIHAFKVFDIGRLEAIRKDFNNAMVITAIDTNKV